MITAVVVALASAAVAQTSEPSLAELLEASQRLNVDQMISDALSERAEAEYLQSWTDLLPKATAQGVWTYNQYPVSFGGLERVFPENQLDAVLRFDLALIDAYRWVRIRVAASASDGAAERTLAIRDAIARQVIHLYYAYAAALSLREAAGNSLRVAEEQQRLSDIRFAAGAVTELDVLRAKAEVQRNRQVIADVDALVANTQRELQRVTGLPPPAAIELGEDDLRAERSAEDLQKGVDELPAVRAADRDADVASTIANSALLALVPIVGAQFTERVSNVKGFSGQEAQFNTGLSLTWRLDPTVFMAAQAANAAATAAQLGAERARIQARDQVHADWQRLHAALSKIEAAAAQAEAAARAAQVARDRYAAGATAQVDVIQAERDTFAAEVGKIQARTELATARAALRLSAGLSPLGGEP